MIHFIERMHSRYERLILVGIQRESWINALFGFVFKLWNEVRICGAFTSDEDSMELSVDDQ
jgi:hypothetical protein